jgi:hypothetical protein
VGTDTGAKRVLDACPGDLPRACNRIWRYLEMLGVEPCERGRITLRLLDKAMETNLAEGGLLTPAAMDALTAWLAECQEANGPSGPCEAAALAECAHPAPCRQTMAPERRPGRGSWRRRPHTTKPAGKYSA